MKARMLRLLVVAALALALGGIMAACGGGEQLTLEEYFQQLERFDDQADQRFEPVEAALQQALDSAGSDEERVEAYRTFLGQNVSILEEYVDGTRDLDPPAEVEDAHKAIVEAADDTVGLLEDSIDELEDVESEADLEAFFLEDDRFAEAGKRFDEACLGLQAIADEKSIDVDLECDGDEE